MNKIVKKIASAVMSVTIFAGSAIPVFAESEQENNIETFKSAYSEMMKNAVNYVDGFQQLTEDDFYAVYTTLPNGEKVLDGYFTDYGKEGTRVYKAPNGRFYLSAATDKNLGDAKIQFFEEKFEAFVPKTIDGLTYVTLDGMNYEFYYNLDKENGIVELYMNSAFDMTYTQMPELFLKYLTTEDTLYSCIEKCMDYTSSDVFMFELGLIRYRSIRENSGNPDMNTEDLKIISAIMQTSKYISYANSNLANDEKIQLSESLSNVIYDTDFNDNIHCNPYKYLQGDVDGNGTVDVKDLALTKQYLINETELLTIQKKLASTQCKDDLDILDVTRISQYIVKLIDEF